MTRDLSRYGADWLASRFTAGSVGAADARHSG